MAARPMFQAGGMELERTGAFPLVTGDPLLGYRLPGATAPRGPFRSTEGAFNPGRATGIPGAEVLPNLTVVPRGGMDTTTARTKGVTPIGKFAVILLLFALAVFFLPKGIRGWFVLIILLGALTVNEGAIGEFQAWALGR